ncbi:MAG TPA: 16S rRNA (guanine(966)-N(2))-methyltransferase RsmD [Psychromonas hadalis]|nr:16S rRNA (guanine(966)-N(2))-methyltransferase RsmD [Psychromonas hadalis]
MRRNQAIKSQGKSKKPEKEGLIRLISGKWRGKKLPVILLDGLRPTTDRTKETLFNWLMYDIRDARCLDCFSGSGSLAFEALSRFAKNVVMLERDKQVAKQLQANCAMLDAENGKVVCIDSLSFLQKENEQPFDLVFIDPPFNMGLAALCCELLEKNNYLTSNALIYIETEVNLSLANLPLNWQLLKEKTTAQVAYRLYQRVVG